MSLQKTHTSSSGHDGNYWKITSLSIARGDCDAMNVLLSLFKDSTAAGDGSTPLEVQEYSWNSDDTDDEVDEYTGSFDVATLDVVNQNPQERVYVKLKTLTTPVDFTTGTTDV